MYGQTLKPHIDDHAKAQPENAEQDADQQQPVPIEGPIQKADLGKVRQLERSFAAGGLAGWLSQSRGGAEDGKRRESPELFQRTAS